MTEKQTPWKYISITVLLVVLVGGCIYYYAAGLTSKPKTEVVQEVATPVPAPAVEDIYPHSISPQTTLYSALRKLNVSSQVIHQIVQAAKPVSNLGRLLPGTRFQLYHTDPSQTDLAGIKFRFSPIGMLEIKKVADAWIVEEITEEVEVKVMNFSGAVTSTLWQSAQQAEMDPLLISELAEIFAWQVDFAREVRVNDRWRIVVERQFVKGEPYAWGAILAAEYVNGNQTYSAVLFRNGKESLGYFAPDGTSLRRMFLKSPIQYARISSRFNKQRFHPILKTFRAHLGVDYAAPKGTPIRTVGDGTVTYAGWRGGGGKTIKIRHNSSYETAYKHLNGFAPKIRAGTKVKQGQTIGYVGNTGLSTGSHLHFEFFHNGRYLDPMGRKFPSADPVPKPLLSQFQSEARVLLSSLPPWENADLSSRNATVE